MSVTYEPSIGRYVLWGDAETSTSAIWTWYWDGREWQRIADLWSDWEWIA